MRLLSEEEETDASVSWEDQQNINSFSKYNAKLSDLEELYETKKRDKEFWEDLQTEMELMDEDEKVRYKIGDSFMFLSLPEASERLEKELDGLTDSLESTKQELDAVNEKMDQLKTVLYAKFGKAINLER